MGYNRLRFKAKHGSNIPKILEFGKIHNGKQLPEIPVSYCQLKYLRHDILKCPSSLKKYNEIQWIDCTPKPDQ